MMWARACRLHQWAKNALIFLPAAAAHLAPTPELGIALGTAFLSFSLLASAVYLLNDLVDIVEDRQHPSKRFRPLASGQMSLGAARAAIPLLTLVSFALAWTLPMEFLQAWAAYLVLTTGYSFLLRRLVVVDVVLLAALYTLRVIAGAAAVSVPLSRWFLAFGVFLFFSLALVKRLMEITPAGASQAALGAVSSDRRRGWEPGDRPVLMALGVASSMAAALVYCLYITDVSAQVLYAQPDRLWLGLPLILYWLARVWLLAHRGEVHHDPVVFALRDRASYAVLIALALALAFAGPLDGGPSMEPPTTSAVAS